MIYEGHEDYEYFVRLKNSHESRISENEVYIQCASMKILRPLEGLLKYLTVPNKLIEARKHKLIDYEASFNDMKVRYSDATGLASKEVKIFFQLENI